MYTLIPKVSFYFDNHSFRVDNTYEVKKRKIKLFCKQILGLGVLVKTFGI